MAASSLIRLLTALLMLAGLALSSSLAWAQDLRYENEEERAVEAEQQEPRPEDQAIEERPGYEQEPRAQIPEQEPYMEEQEPMAAGPSTGWIVTRSAFLGGVVGALIGTGGYLLSDQDWDPWVIAYTAGGGIVLGAAIGFIDALTRDDQPGYASVDFMERDLPKTVRIPVLNLKF